jgi:hypothetical protein
VPWSPELFSAPALGRIWEDERRRRRRIVPFFAGIVTGETEALVASFAGEPELHHPVRGRIKGVPAFERWAVRTSDWLADQGVRIEDVDDVITGDRGVEEVVLHGEGIELPVAVVSEHEGGGAITEQRMYFAARLPTGRPAVRPPLLQPGAPVAVPGAVDEHLRAFYERLGADGGPIVLEHCAVNDDGRACALEYNVVAEGRPRAGLAVCVRGDDGRLAAARIYDDAVPPA